MTNDFRKSHRLLSAKDFESLRIDSKKKRHGPLVAYYKANDGGLSRVGISVSSKTFNSVQRNKIKRIIRENFRKSPAKQISIDVLFVLVERTKKQDFAKMTKELYISFETIIDNILKNIKADD